ncbi:unnamed protein product, partial [marine sediment metagenome]
ITGSPEPVAKVSTLAAQKGRKIHSPESQRRLA